MTRSRPSGDGGFTLVELLMAVVILGVIIYPLGNFVLGYLDNVNETQGRLSESHDMQIASAYFSQDAANVGLRNYAAQQPYPLQQSVWTSGFSGPCSSAPAVPAGGTPILMLKWDNFTTVTTTGGATVGSRVTDTVTYYTIARTLHRVYCPADAATGPDLVMVHNLAATNPTAVTCSSQCDAANVPARVVLTLNVQGAAAATPTPVVLVGQRRQGA